VGTDNWAVDFKFISTRLVTEIVQQYEAAASRHDRSWSAGIKGIAVSSKKRGPNFDNRFDLARRATEAVTNLTGTLDVGGDYVRGVLDFHHCITAVHQGWEDTANAEIAILVSDFVNDGERSFVALFGSVGSYIGHAPTLPISGWFPSDADGLYRILSSCLEPTDDQVDSVWLADDARHDDLSRFDSALTITETVDSDRRTEPLEFLARADTQIHNVHLDGKQFRHVLLGAAVWARTPRPVPLQP